MSNIETSPIPSETPPRAISEEEFLGIFQEIKSLPKFTTYDDFIQSDFFRTNYQISLSDSPIHWIHEIAKQKNVKVIDPTHKSHGKSQIDFLGAISREEQLIESKNLQRMLIALGYLTQEDFFPNPEKVESGEVDETDKAFFGFLGTPDTKAAFRFQKHKKIREDSIVGPITQDNLYQNVFELFHKERYTPDIRLRLEVLKKEANSGQ